MSDLFEWIFSNVDVGCLEIMMMMFLVEVWIIFLVRQKDARRDFGKEQRRTARTNHNGFSIPSAQSMADMI